MRMPDTSTSSWPARRGRAGLQLALAGLLGVAAALLVSCGSSTQGLIPANYGGPLRTDFAEVSQAAQSGDCSATETAIAKTEQDFAALPAAVDAGLRGTLRQGIDNLRSRALVRCAQLASATTSTGSTVKTTTTATTTTTAPATTPATTTTTTPATSTPTTTPTTTPPGAGGGTPPRGPPKLRPAAPPGAGPASVKRAPAAGAGARPGRRQMSAVEIAGRYRLEGRLGYGGMSTVHLALDLRLERQVAVKLLAEHLADEPAFVSRFQREAQAAARLVHPNIVQVFDSGRDEQTGQYFIVMEYIEGSSGAEILRDQGWVEVEEALSIIEQACEGLDYAHRHGVVHRDVKPGNLLRSREGEVKLADFGIAKATEQSSITQVGSVLGTAAYLAPEQARGEEAGPSADLYALGVVTYQLISGRLPYEASSLTELALKQQQEAPAMLDTLVAAVTPELAEAVAIALALEVGDRYQTAREMGRGLRDGAHGIAPGAPARRTRSAPPTQATSVLSAGARPAARGGTVAPRRPRPGTARAVPAAQAAPRAAGPGRQRGARRLVAAALAVLAVALVIVAVVVATAPAPTKIVLRNVVYEDVGKASAALEQLVSENESR